MNKGKSIIKRPTVTGTVADTIRRRIVSAELAGGEVIRQEALAAELGVSRIPVREALLQLEAEGLVIIHTHRGAEVARLTKDDAWDLFEARLMIEPVVLAQAVANLSDGDIDAIGKALRNYERGIATEAEPEELSRLNWQFHAAMCFPARRPRLFAILQSLYTATDRYLRLQIEPGEAKQRALTDHRSLYEAIAKRASATAVKRIRLHIEGAYQDVMRSLEKQA